MSTPRIVLVVTVYEDPDNEPKANITVGDGFDEHKHDIAELFRHFAQHWSDQP